MGTTPTGRGEDSAGSLTFDLRGLVWGIESEVAQITGLCRRIDEHVRAVHVVRTDAAQRLTALDELFDVTQDAHLRAWLETSTGTALPTVAELFPDRLYTD